MPAAPLTGAYDSDICIKLRYLRPVCPDMIDSCSPILSFKLVLCVVSCICRSTHRIDIVPSAPELLFLYLNFCDPQTVFRKSIRLLFTLQISHEARHTHLRRDLQKLRVNMIRTTFWFPEFRNVFPFDNFL